MSDRGVVHYGSVISEAEFHSAMLCGLARAARHGKGALADAMELTGRALDKIFTGSHPHPKRLWDALALEPTLLDDIAALYGRRLTHTHAADLDDRAAPALVAALHKVVEAEADGTIDHQELFSMEQELIAAELVIQRLRARIAAIRKPRSVG